MPAAGPVWVGDDRAADDGGVGQVLLGQLDGVLAADDRAEAGVEQHRAVEAVAQALDQLVGRVLMQNAQARRLQIGDVVHQGGAGGQLGSRGSRDVVPRSPPGVVQAKGQSGGIKAKRLIQQWECILSSQSRTSDWCSGNHGADSHQIRSQGRLHL